MSKVTTGKVRFSFCHIWEPQVPQDGGDPKYSITILIPKDDTKTVQLIKAAMKEAAEGFRAKNGQSSLPANPSHTMHDGDGTRPSGDPFGPECKGCYVMTINTKDKPVIVDKNRQEILDPSEVYSGCYGRVCMDVYAYNSHGKKGISAKLRSVLKLADGEPFGSRGSASDFDDDFKDPDAAGDDDDWI